MRPASTCVILTLLAIVCDCGGTEGTRGTCESPQYLELYTEGIINCLFHEDFFGVLWYNTTEYTENDPILDYQDMVKSGVGYESGEFDVYPNGSLIINNVLPHHDLFTVAYIHTKKELPVFNDIRVIAFIKPEIGYPVISLCSNSRRCYSQVSLPSVTCSVSEVRPLVTLSLLSRTTNGDKNISNELSILTDGEGYTSHVVTGDVFHYSHLLTLLVCKVSIVPGMLEQTESLVLVQNDDFESLPENATVKYVKRNTGLYLSCDEKKIGFVVWKWISLLESTENKILLYSVFIGETFTEIFAENISLQGVGSLVVPRIQVKNEGRYTCYFGDGLSDGLKMFDVNILVSPVPAYPLIEGCNHRQYCALEVKHEGNLTCAIKGIRPQAELEWGTFYEDDEYAVKFTNQQSTVSDNGETFDVTLVSTYRIIHERQEQLTLECKVSGSIEAFRHITAKLDLVLVKGNHPLSNQTPSPTSTSSLPWVIPVIVFALCILFAVSGVLVKKYLRKRSNLEPTERNEAEMDSMLDANLSNNAEAHSSSTSDYNAIKLQFIKQLQDTYKDLCDAVQPVPYIKDEHHSVDKVFVEGGIEYLDSMKGGTRGRWVSLNSYQNVFHDPRIKTTRLIIEGEPGYGKTTITLRFAYDWCTSKLKDTEILILLKLRQLRGIKSIYTAIKQLLLPTDSRLGEDDIKNIFQESNSVVIILDGFDQYTDRDDDSFEVNKIIARKMFRNFKVVLTTRTSILPSNYPPTAKRIRLTGFDDNARRDYICKAVTIENETDALKVERFFNEYPILNDLCHVTRNFVLFAHTKYETDNCEDLNMIPSNSTENIIDYLNKFDGSDKLAILCILGLTEKTANIKEPIRQLCDEGVVISGHDELLLQRLYIQLLEIAAAKEIPIKQVVLYNCLQSVDLSTSAVRTTSGLALTSRIPFKLLQISLYNREITDDEYIAILQFSSVCLSLSFLWFNGSVPPQSFKVDSSLTKLKSRNVEVKWMMFIGDPDYILNLETGRWQNETDGKELTREEFEKMRLTFAEKVGIMTEDYHRQGTKKIRDFLREQAEELRKSNPK